MKPKGLSTDVTDIVHKVSSLMKNVFTHEICDKTIIQLRYYSQQVKLPPCQFKVLIQIDCG